MRVAPIAFAACTMSAAGCLDGESGRLVTPSEAATLHSTSDSVGIVEPLDGQTVYAGEAFLLRVEQHLRSGPLQGRAQVQVLAAGSPWQDLGDAFPWTRQGAEFSTFAAIGAPGSFRIRVRAFADEERMPFLETDPVQVYSLGTLGSAPMPSLVALRRARREPPPR